jgi:hypothetical protein
MQESVSGRESILLILPDRAEAEAIAAEVRRRGHPVVVRPIRSALREPPNMAILEA